MMSTWTGSAPFLSRSPSSFVLHNEQSSLSGSPRLPMRLPRARDTQGGRFEAEWPDEFVRGSGQSLQVQRRRRLLRRSPTQRSEASRTRWLRVLASIGVDSRLDGLTSSTDAAAKSLANIKANSVSTGPFLSIESAKYLAQHDGKINLYGLSNLSDEAAAAFGNKESLNESGHTGSGLPTHSQTIHIHVKNPHTSTKEENKTLSPSNTCQLLVNY